MVIIGCDQGLIKVLFVEGGTKKVDGEKKGEMRGLAKFKKLSTFADLGLFEVSQSDQHWKGDAMDGLRKCLGENGG